MAWTLVILSALLLPSDRLPTPPLGGVDKIAHAVLFLAWGLSCHRSGLVMGRVLILGLALAIGTEAGQWLMDMGRTADIADVTADLVGIALGATVSRMAGSGEPRLARGSSEHDSPH